MPQAGLHSCTPLPYAGACLPLSSYHVVVLCRACPPPPDLAMTLCLPQASWWGAKPKRVASPRMGPRW